MNYLSPQNFDFYADLLSTFDISGTINNKSILPLSKGLDYDMKQLSEDQGRLYEDYKKATERLMQDIFLGDDNEHFR